LNNAGASGYADRALRGFRPTDCLRNVPFLRTPPIPCARTGCGLRRKDRRGSAPPSAWRVAAEAGCRARVLSSPPHNRRGLSPDVTADARVSPDAPRRISGHAFAHFSPHFQPKRTRSASLSRQNRPIPPLYHSNAAKNGRFFGYGATHGRTSPVAAFGRDRETGLNGGFVRDPVRFTARSRVPEPRGAVNRPECGLFPHQVVTGVCPPHPGSGRRHPRFPLSS
jgi:hypothetical protein